MENIETWEDAHEGGFAKRTPELLACMRQWETDTQIELDAIYTGKLLLALKKRFELDSVNRPSFLSRGSKILLFHTGGLQGNRSWKTKC